MAFKIEHKAALSSLHHGKDESSTQLKELPKITQQTQPYLQAATSHNTRKAYQADIRHFMSWGGLLPTTAEIIIQYLTSQAELLNTRTLTRRLTALRQWHLYQGFRDPTVHPLVRKILTGIKHVHGQPKVKALPFTLETLTVLIQHLQKRNQFIDWRNQALVQVGFFGAFRRSELASIQVEQIRFIPEGMEILIPRSKTDQHGEGHWCALPYGHPPLCPVTATRNWLEKSQIQQGPLFRRLTRSQDLTEQALTPGQINRLIQALVRSCGLPHAERYSSHSLRRGFATTASQKGAPFSAIMRQGRWRHEGTVLGYIEEGQRFETNAASFILNHLSK